jgi:hypothetical protein
MSYIKNWRTRMLAADGSGGAGEQAPAGNAAPGNGPQDTQTGQATAPAGQQANPQNTGANDAAAAQQRGGGPAKPEMSAEERHAAAEQRRQREQRQRNADIEALKAQHKAENDMLARAMGYKSFEEMVKLAPVNRLNEALQSKGTLDPDALQAMIQLSARQNQMATQAADRAAVETVAAHDLQQEFRDFQANPEFADSGIKAIADFTKQPWYSKFYGLLTTGDWTISEAYAACNVDAITKRRAEAAKQAAINNVAGKDHLKPTGGGADGLDGVVVPEDVMENYRFFNPGMKPEDIRKHYAGLAKQQQKGT